MSAAHRTSPQPSPRHRGSPRRRGLRTTLAVTCALSLAATACGDDDDGGEAGPGGEAPVAPDPVSGGELRVGVEAEIDNFLPGQGRWSSSSLFVARAVYDPLTAFDVDGQAQPYLAELITPNDDHTVWTITVREGIEFHDGTALDAEALRFNLDQVMLQSLLTSSAFAPVETVEATGEREVTVTLNQSWAHLPLVLANQTGFIVSPAQYDDPEGARNPVGTGPFTFDRWESGVEIAFNRNESYWQTDDAGTQLPYLASVVFQPVVESTSRREALGAGDLDLVHSQASQDVESVLNGTLPDGVRGLVDQSEGTESNVMFNSETGAFSDVRLRRAAAMAIDREDLVATVFGGAVDVANGPFREDSGFGTIENFPGFDPDAAKALVDEWKAENGGAAPKVVLDALPAAETRQIGDYIKSQWNAVGFEAEMEIIEESVGTGNLVSGDFEAVLWGFWDRPDPDALYHYLHSDSGLNFPNYYSDATDAALDTARALSDPAERAEAYQAMWDDWGENVPIVFLFHATWALLYRDNVWGIGTASFPDGSPVQPITWGNTFLTRVFVVN